MSSCFLQRNQGKEIHKILSKQYVPVVLSNQKTDSLARSPQESQRVWWATDPLKSKRGLGLNWEHALVIDPMALKRQVYCML